MCCGETRFIGSTQLSQGRSSSTSVRPLQTAPALAAQALSCQPSSLAMWLHAAHTAVEHQKGVPGQGEVAPTNAARDTHDVPHPVWQPAE